MKRKQDSDDWPTFDAPLLQDIAAAFNRRYKAIAYQADRSGQREFSESAMGAVEQITSRALQCSLLSAVLLN